jgi:hypothetical protein
MYFQSCTYEDLVQLFLLNLQLVGMYRFLYRKFVMVLEIDERTF